VIIERVHLKGETEAVRDSGRKVGKKKKKK